MWREMRYIVRELMPVARLLGEIAAVLLPWLPVFVLAVFLYSNEIIPGLTWWEGPPVVAATLSMYWLLHAEGIWPRDNVRRLLLWGLPVVAASILAGIPATQFAPLPVGALGVAAVLITLIWRRMVMQ